MPTIISEPNRKHHTSEELRRLKYDYEYPEGLDLKPGSEIHDKIVEEVYQRARESHLVVSQRFDSWRKIEKSVTSYIPADEDEQSVLEQDSRKPVSIVFPYSYAILETLLTYMMSAFVQDPIFRYEGTSPEDTVGAIMLEKLVQKQAVKTKVPLALHTFFRDAFMYGTGYVAPDWYVRYGTKNKQRTSGKLSSLGRLIGRTTEQVSEPSILFEGNCLNNIDPYQALPDPSVSSDRIQEGEFFGWVEESSLVRMLDTEQSDQDYFNVKYLRHIGEGETSIFNKDESDREKTTTRRQKLDESVTFPIDTIHMYINIIPADWGLGDSEYPEKWLFSVSSDQVVTRAKPLNLNHGMYPIASASPDGDGYSPLPLGRMETLYGLQNVADFMFNSHVTNVRKAINDMFVVDPYLINMNDVRNPEPGKLIRMRRPAWGRGVKDAVVQLGVTDVTRQNLSDTQFIQAMMNHVAGVDESMMGSLRQGGPERLTSAEFQGTRGSAMSRLERIAKVIGLQGMQDIGYMFASHAQQLMSEETYVKTTGRWEDVLKQEYKVDKDRMKVSPNEIDIDYDVDVRDGSVPGSNFSESWIDMFKIIGQDPELRQDFDVPRLFKHIARNLGAQNVNEFDNPQKSKKSQQGNQPSGQVMSDENVQEEVRKGNLKPLGGQ